MNFKMNHFVQNCLFFVYLSVFMVQNLAEKMVAISIRQALDCKYYLSQVQFQKICWSRFFAILAKNGHFFAREINSICCFTTNKHSHYKTNIYFYILLFIIIFLNIFRFFLFFAKNVTGLSTQLVLHSVLCPSKDHFLVPSTIPVKFYGFRISQLVSRVQYLVRFPFRFISPAVVFVFRFFTQLFVPISETWPYAERRVIWADWAEITG